MSAVVIRRHSASLVIALSLAFIPVISAHADTSDDCAACLIGKAAVALHKQDRKDSGKALEVAYKALQEAEGHFRK